MMQCDGNIDLLHNTKYTGWSDCHSHCGHVTISVSWGKTAYYVKLSGGDLSSYSNKIESVGLSKCPSVLSLSY